MALIFAIPTLAIGSVLLLIGTAEEIAVAITLLVPMSIGGLFGVLFTPKTWLQWLLLFPMILLALLGLYFEGMNGLFCSLIAFVIWALPVTLCAVIATLCCRGRPRSATEIRTWLPFLLLPFIGDAVERLLPFTPPECSVTTARVVEAPPETVFAKLRFYDEIEREPPIWFRLGFPRPLRTEGPFDKLGDEQTCLYDVGLVKKRLDERVPGRSLGFTVIEEDHRYERSIGLRRGDFRLTPVGTGTLVEVTTRFEARLRPRWVWAPFENGPLHGFHDHILDALEESLASRKWAGESRDGASR